MKPGIHASVSGGLDRALDTLEGLGLPCGQIFTSNQRQWKGRQVKAGEIDRFSCSSLEIVSHASYLINLAAIDERVAGLSISNLETELERMNMLGIRWCVLHPGAHLGSGEDRGIEKISSSVRKILLKSPASTGILFENTAGQGTTIGGSFGQLEKLLTLTGIPERTGICFDTCHAFAAGYDLSSRQAILKTIRNFDRIVGSGSIRAFHLNDSKSFCGSHHDRHAVPGEGMIGLEPLRYLANLPEFREIPAIAETPGSDSDRADSIFSVIKQQG